MNFVRRDPLSMPPATAGCGDLRTRAGARPDQLSAAGGGDLQHQPQTAVVRLGAGEHRRSQYSGRHLHTATLLALMRLGLATLTIHDGLPALPFNIDALISDAEIPGSTGGRVVRVDHSWMQGDGRPIDPRYVPSTDEKTICRLMLTSGSTGIPKAVAVSQRLLSDRINRHLTVFGNKFPGCDRLYSDMLISTSLGFQFLIYSLLRGGTIIFPGDRFDLTLQAIEEYKVQCLIAPPGGLENFVRWFDTIPAYQSSIELIFCGGDILSSSLSNRCPLAYLLTYCCRLWIDRGKHDCGGVRT